MAIDDKIREEKCNSILTEKLQKYQHFHLEKLIYEYLTGEEILPPNQSQMTEQSKFTYSLLQKALEK